MLYSNFSKTFCLVALCTLFALFGKFASAQEEDLQSRELGKKQTAKATASKLAEPDKAARINAKKLIDEIYEKDIERAKTSRLKSALAKKVLQDAKETSDDPSGRYALLLMARDLAGYAGDPETAMQAVDQLDKYYKIDAISLKTKSLEEIAEKKVLNAEAKAAVAQLALELIDEAFEKENYDAAKLLATIVLELARKPPRDKELLKTILARRKIISSITKEYSKAKVALATLEKDPANPEANLTVGQFRCFYKGDWQKGLMMLALGSDTKLKTLSTLDLSKPSTAKAQLKVADGWYSLANAKDAPEVQKGGLQSRALHWYELALPNVSGLAKAKVTKRIKELQESDSLKAAPKKSYRKSIVFIAKASMQLYEVGTRHGEFPRQQVNDPRGPFVGKPVYFKQKTGKDVVYEIQWPTPVRQIYFKGAAMQKMLIEVRNRSGKVVAQTGPHGGGNHWGEFILNIPAGAASRHFYLRLHNEVSTWFFIAELKMR